MKTKAFIGLIFVAVSIVALTTNLYAGCGGCGTHTTTAKTETASKSVKQLTIVETAVAAGSFNTLVTAVKAAGLAETLSGSGPFTVFAPTDDAFAKLPQGTIDKLLKDPKQLASILTYHVVPGEVKAADVVKMTKAKTVQGESFAINAGDKGVKVNNANVVQTDIQCANGVIHVIDEVLLPN